MPKSPNRKRAPWPKTPISPREERAEARRKKRDLEILESRLREAKKNRLNQSMGRGEASVGEGRHVVDLESSIVGEEISVKGKENDRYVKAGEHGLMRGDKNDESMREGNDAEEPLY